MARPTLYTPELVDTICDKLAGGTPLAVILREDGMPGRSTVDDWRAKDTAIAAKFDQARDDGWDFIAWECKTIADTPMPGIEERWEWVVIDSDPANPQVKPVREWKQVEKRVADCIQHRKLQIETRLKLLAKWDPRRYGDRLDLNHSGQLTLEQLVGQAVAKPASSSSNDAAPTEAAAA